MTRLTFAERNRRMELLETIARRDLPDRFSSTYEAKGVKNWVSSRFLEEDPERTLWVMDNEFKLSGLMALMGFFMRGAFSKQTLEEMDRFKAFAESA